MNANAELTLRKRLNAKKKKAHPKKKGKTSAPTKTVVFKRPSTKMKNQTKKQTAASKDESGKDCDAAEKEEVANEEEEEEANGEEEEEQADEVDDEVRNKEAASSSKHSGSKANKFSLKTAQMRSKKKKKDKKNTKKRPAATTPKDINKEDQQDKKKKTQQEDGNKKGGEGGGRMATTDTPAANEDRKKARNRMTSFAYYKKFDELKATKKDGFEPGTEEWNDKMNKAKEEARLAHREAGKKFDLENPKEQLNNDDKKGEQPEKRLGSGARAGLKRDGVYLEILIRLVRASFFCPRHCTCRATSLENFESTSSMIGEPSKQL